MNFNFPTKKGSGIERLLPHAGTDSIDLINKLCTYDPDERMTAKQALRHIYFKELRYVNIIIVFICLLKKYFTSFCSSNHNSLFEE